MTFEPLLSPYEALELGVFDGTYFKGDYRDFVESPTVSPTNLFMEQASQPMSVWLEKGWITPEDPLGWLQWYTRYYHGRRLNELDEWQIKRHRSFVARHSAQVKKNGNGDLTKRLKQRQALLHWCADPIPDVDVNDKVNYLKNFFTSL
tara:strand:+ start:592 stop:1035 length:444 start_codon:yes stop_codon:yes gene_type:complete